MKRIVSGIQPTGTMHLGNYLGAVRNWVALQDQGECFFFIADLHSLTEVVPAPERKRSIEDMILMLMASGIDPNKATLFRQSRISAHSELAWFLMCTARTGWLNRMVQFKEKSGTLSMMEVRKRVTDMTRDANAGKDVAEALSTLRADLKVGLNSEGSSAGLYTYPVLQAADILLYQATHVPVGEDQFQHLQLTRDIAQSFNHNYGETFTLPEALMTKMPRVMSLFDPNKKMSKSDPNPEHRIEMLDSPDVILRKMRRATSETEMLPSSVDGLVDRKAASNLLSLYAELAGIDLSNAVDQFAGRGFGPLKADLTDLLVSHLEPIQSRYAKLQSNRGEVLRAFGDNMVRAYNVALDTMVTVEEKVFAD